MSNADVKVAGHTVKCSWGKESGDPNNLPTNAQVSSTNIQFQKCHQKPLKWRSYQIDKDNESLKISVGDPSTFTWRAVSILLHDRTTHPRLLHSPAHCSGEADDIINRDNKKRWGGFWCWWSFVFVYWQINIRNTNQLSWAINKWSSGWSPIQANFVSHSLIARVVFDQFHEIFLQSKKYQRLQKSQIWNTIGWNLKRTFQTPTFGIPFAFN